MLHLHRCEYKVPVPSITFLLYFQYQHIGEVPLNCCHRETKLKLGNLRTSVADLDPPDPHVIGPPGAESGSFFH
jgi:hypothetical protein